MPNRSPAGWNGTFRGTSSSSRAIHQNPANHFHLLGPSGFDGKLRCGSCWIHSHQLLHHPVAHCLLHCFKKKLVHNKLSRLSLGQVLSLQEVSEMLSLDFVDNLTIYHGESSVKIGQFFLNGHVPWLLYWRVSLPISAPQPVWQLTWKPPKQWRITNWWFQPLWKILVRLDHHPNYWGK